MPVNFPEQKCVAAVAIKLYTTTSIRANVTMLTSVILKIMKLMIENEDNVNKS